MIDNHDPLVEKQVRERDCPQLSHDIKTKKNERDYYLRRDRNTGDEIYWLTYRRLRNTVTRLIRRSKANYSIDVIRENTDSPKRFWDQIKKVYPAKDTKVSQSRIFKVGDELSSNNKTYC